MYILQQAESLQCSCVRGYDEHCIVMRRHRYENDTNSRFAKYVVLTLFDPHRLHLTLKELR